jgi:hypothetical protein
MSNNLNLYDPLFYANEALIQLHKALGMAGRVHRGYDKNPQQKGSTIEINRPSTFSAQDAPSTAQDLNPGAVAMKLTNWKEVKFKLTDKELTFTTEKVITDHIVPMAYALADNIDSALCALAYKVPYFATKSAPATVADVTALRAKLFGNKVPLSDPNAVHVMVDGVAESELLALSAFTQNQGAGAAGVASQLTGSLGTRFGMEFFSNQNVVTQAAGTGADVAGAVNNAAGYAIGSTTIAVDGISAAAVLKAGTPFTIAGSSRSYVVDADATADGTGAIAALTIFPGLDAAVVDNAVVTFDIAGHTKNVAFHRNAFALAMAPLTDIGNQLGAKVASVADPITGLALRSRLFYVGDSSTVYVALDVLYGVACLDERLAAIWRG